MCVMMHVQFEISLCVFRTRLSESLHISKIISDYDCKKKKCAKRLKQSSIQACHPCSKHARLQSNTHTINSILDTALEGFLIGGSSECSGTL